MSFNSKPIAPHQVHQWLDGSGPKVTISKMSVSVPGMLWKFIPKIIRTLKLGQRIWALSSTLIPWTLMSSDSCILNNSVDHWLEANLRIHTTSNITCSLLTDCLNAIWGPSKFSSNEAGTIFKCKLIVVVVVVCVTLN